MTVSELGGSEEYCGVGAAGACFARWGRRSGTESGDEEGSGEEEGRDGASEGRGDLVDGYASAGMMLNPERNVDAGVGMKRVGVPARVAEKRRSPRRVVNPQTASLEGR